MESSIVCIVNLEGINYKVLLEPETPQTKIDLNYLKKYLSESRNEELPNCDILKSDRHFIEIYDSHFKEFVCVENNVALQNKDRIRIRCEESNAFQNGCVETIEDELLLVPDVTAKRNLVDIVIQYHPELESLAHRNKRFRRTDQMDECIRIKEKFWVAVSVEMSITQNYKYTPKQCMDIFFGLLSQYQYILRRYKKCSEEKCQEMWPLFKLFHYKVDCKLFSRGFGSLQTSFDATSKNVFKESSSKRKAECTRVEEDFNLITAVLNRMAMFRRPPRAAAWKVVGEDMAEFESHSARMAGLRWQKRFHELLLKYCQLSSHGSQSEKDSWPVYNLFSQIDVTLFMKIPDRAAKNTSKRAKSSQPTKDPIHIDLSDSEADFIVIDETPAVHDDTPMVDFEEEDIRECVMELLNEMVDKVVALP